MNPSEVLRIVDAIHRDKNIDKEIVFEGIEAALVSAAKKHFGEDGSIAGTHNGVPLDPTEMAERIGAQTAKQVMIQKIREAERDALYNEYDELRDQLVTGVVQRYDGGTERKKENNNKNALPCTQHYEPQPERRHHLAIPPH
jgi:transcription termination/antitermination protein NusA